tara:strand:- start:3606 stop:4775 length:1170 start_codon:yes stop_codon:yes gene_type:complete
MARKKTKTRNIYVTKEPDWKKFMGLTDPEEQEKAFRSVDYFVHSEISTKDAVAKYRKWVKEASGWAPEEIKVILKNPDWRFSSSAKYAWCWDKLGYMPECFAKFYDKKKDDLITTGKEVVEEQQEKKKEAKPKISIQERMLDQITDLCGQWEDLIDKFIETGKINIKSFDPEKDMKVYAGGGVIKPNHAKLIKENFTAIHEEAKESLAGTCDQLNEAYNFMNKKMKQDYVAFFEKIMNACDALILTGKANRKQRKPRARSKDAIIKKMKFQVSDGSLGIASISPTDVVYANEVWVYNTKTRKVGVYHAKNKDPRNLQRAGAGLMVKGTTFQDFDPETSVQKTLRKPAEQINNWTGNAKTRFAKAFDEVKTTPTKLTGRLNDTTIILKAF